MNTILIATDFSDCARNASIYGLQLAKALSAKVVMLNVCQPVPEPAERSLTTTCQEQSDSIRKRFSEELRRLQSYCDDVQIEKRIEPGIPSDVISSVAATENASWIIAGMRSSSTLRKLLGGVVVTLSRYTALPLILVPEGASFKRPGIIALASNIHEDADIDMLKPLRLFGEKFETKLFVVRVVNKGTKEAQERLSSPERIGRYLKELTPSYTSLTDNDVTHALNEFVKATKVDLVAMISQEHGLIDGVFKKSTIKDMIIQTSVPLLVLPEKLMVTYNQEPDNLEQSIM